MKHVGSTSISRQNLAGNAERPVAGRLDSVAPDSVVIDIHPPVLEARLHGLYQNAIQHQQNFGERERATKKELSGLGFFQRWFGKGSELRRELSRLKAGQEIQAKRVRLLSQLDGKTLSPQEQNLIHYVVIQNRIENLPNDLNVVLEQVQRGNKILAQVRKGSQPAEHLSAGAAMDLSWALLQEAVTQQHGYAASLTRPGGNVIPDDRDGRVFNFLKQMPGLRSGRAPKTALRLDLPRSTPSTERFPFNQSSFQFWQNNESPRCVFLQWL